MCVGILNFSITHMTIVPVDLVVVCVTIINYNVLVGTSGSEPLLSK